MFVSDCIHWCNCTTHSKQNTSRNIVPHCSGDQTFPNEDFRIYGFLLEGVGIDLTFLIQQAAWFPWLVNLVISLQIQWWSILYFFCDPVSPAVYRDSSGASSSSCVTLTLLRPSDMDPWDHRNGIGWCPHFKVHFPEGWYFCFISSLITLYCTIYLFHSVGCGWSGPEQWIMESASSVTMGKLCKLPKPQFLLL